MNDISRTLQQQVIDAAAEGRPLQIIGSGSKDFLGRATHGEPLSISEHRGITHYEPVELVLTARAGTPLKELETALAAEGQMLPFEPPHFGDNATLGGTVAAGLSGPRRPFAGAVRDHVLGCTLLNGKGELLHFGGEVMKNVAGYDVSRLMSGAMGTLGVLLEVSIKVLPRPAEELTLAQPCNFDRAIALMNNWSARPLPLSAACCDGKTLTLRLSGAGTAVNTAKASIGGEEVNDGDRHWHSLREQQHPFFESELPLWRLSVPPATPHLSLPGKWLIDWGGAQRWLLSDAEPQQIWQAAAGAGGHATLFRRGDSSEVYQPLPEPLMALHRNLKRSFDPKGILNPGRLYGAL